MNDDRSIDISQPTDVYTIAHFPYGIAIRGEVPQHIFPQISYLISSFYNLDVCDAILEDALNAFVVFTTKEKSMLWRKHLGLSID